MYRLYWAPACGSFAPHAALIEAGAEFDLIEVDLDANQQHSPDFLAINPRAQVPVLTLPDGTVMTESVAMLMHIGDRHPETALMPGIGSAQRAVAYRWLMFAAVNLYEAGCRVSHPQYYTSEAAGHEGVRDKSQNDLNAYWTMAADAIGDGPFFFGTGFSAVDLCLLMIAQWHPDPDGLLRRLPKLARLCGEARRRPAVEDIWHLNFGD